MATRKYFLTKKQISSVFQKYGSGHRWSLRADMSEYGRIIFMDSLDYMLSVNLLGEGSENQFLYIEIHIANSSGIIIRKDRYEYCDISKSRFEFVYTEENGCFYDEFRSISKPSTAIKRNKLANARKLEQQLADTQKLLEFSENRIQLLFEQAEHGFLNSPTYQQMQQEIDFYKSLNKLNDIHLANANKQFQSTAEHLRQVYEDNSRLCKHKWDADYWIGVTERRHDEKDYEKLRDEIYTLKGSIDQKEQAVADRDAEIHRLQLLISEMQCKLRSSPASSDCKDHEELESLRMENDRLREHIASLEEQLTLVPITVRDNTAPIIEQIIERQKEQNTPKKLGRPFVVDKQKKDLVITLRTKGYSIRRIADQLGMSVGNVHRYIKMHENGG